MAIELTPDQERRILAIVRAGNYRTPEEAVDAAVAAVETAANDEFEGSPEELEELLLEGLDSGEAIEAGDEYWQRLRATTERMIQAHRGRHSES